MIKTTCWLSAHLFLNLINGITWKLTQESNSIKVLSTIYQSSIWPLSKSLKMLHRSWVKFKDSNWQFKLQVTENNKKIINNQTSSVVTQSCLMKSLRSKHWKNFNFRPLDSQLRLQLKESTKLKMKFNHSLTHRTQ